MKINEQLNKICFLQLLENTISQTYTTSLSNQYQTLSLSLFFSTSFFTFNALFFYLFLPQFFTFKSELYPCRVLFSWEVFQHSFGMVEAISSKCICADALLTWRETLSSPLTEQRQRSPETPPHLHCERAEAFVVHVRPCSTNYLRIMQVLSKLFLSTDIYRDVTNQSLTDAPSTKRNLHSATSSFMRHFHITKLYLPWYIFQAPCKYCTYTWYPFSTSVLPSKFTEHWTSK